MDPITSALSAAGYALDTPGAYVRGALSGRLGERASGQDLLSTYGLSSEDDPWGGLKGFATEALVDPLALAGPALGAFKGINSLTRGGRALAGMGEAAPLARRLGELKAGVETPLDAVRHSMRQGESANPLLRGLGRFVGEEEGALRPDVVAKLLQAPDNPLGRLRRLSEHTRIGFDPRQSTVLDNFRPEHADSASTLAVYVPRRHSPGDVVPNTGIDAWGSDAAMEDILRRDWNSWDSRVPVDPDAVSIHELGHGFHDMGIPKEGVDPHSYLDAGFIDPQGNPFLPRQRISFDDMTDWEPHRAVLDDIGRHLGSYAKRNPVEFVAEMFANKILRGESVPGHLEDLYRFLHGPNPDKLPPEFLNAWLDRKRGW